MFAPFPAKNDGWFIVVGTSTSGKRYDLFRGRERDFAGRPLRPAEDYNNDRLSKFMSHFRGRGYERLQSSYLTFLKRKWNAEIQERRESLERVEIRWAKESPPKRL